MAMQPYRERLRTVVAERGNLCVGIDPHPNLIQAWGEEVNPTGLERVARGLVAALADRVAVFKPQAAFYESFGAAGVAVLERVVADIREAGALCIMDAKRGDIGSSNQAYADTFLADGAPLAADALTVNPFLGFGALAPFIDKATETGRGLYVLCRTSNAEGPDVQTAMKDGRSVAQYVVDCARETNLTRHDCMGLVIGATNSDLDLDLSNFGGSYLVPGVGAQGGTIDDLKRLFGDGAPNALPTTSRGVMKAGPDPKNVQAAVDILLEELKA